MTPGSCIINVPIRTANVRASVPVRMSKQCVRCSRHLTADSCEAFPKRIPNKILDGKFDHRKPYPGDRGIRFKSI